MPFLGREQEIDVLGRRWKVGRWTMGVWRELLEWARPQIPNPLDAIAKHLNSFSLDAQKYAVDQALDASRSFLSIGSPEIQSVLNSLEGGVRLLWLLLKTHQQNATEDDAYQVAMALGRDRLAAILAAAMGKEGSPQGNA